MHSCLKPSLYLACIGICFRSAGYASSFIARALRAGIPVDKAAPLLPRVAASMLAFCEANASGARASPPPFLPFPAATTACPDCDRLRSRHVPLLLHFCAAALMLHA